VGGQAVYDLVKEALRPLLIGQDPQLIERHWATMYQEVLLAGRRGAAMRAISAVDVALWDLLGKIAGSPLYRLLGGWLTRSRRMPPVGITALGPPRQHSRRCCRTRLRGSPTSR
jgi:L-alanine-DL-glutamate epimerase-like enolase superfamily enzyme